MNSENKKSLTKTQKRRFRRKQQRELKEKIRKLEEKFNLEIKQEKGKINIIFSCSPRSISIIYQIVIELHSFQKRLRFFVEHSFRESYVLHIQTIFESYFDFPIEIDDSIIRIVEDSFEKNYFLVRCKFSRKCRNLIYCEGSVDKEGYIITDCVRCNVCNLDELNFE